MPSRSYLSDFVTLKARSTRHEPRPRLAFPPWCTRAPPPCVPRSRERERIPTGGPKRKKNVFRKKECISYVEIDTRRLVVVGLAQLLKSSQVYSGTSTIYINPVIDAPPVIVSDALKYYHPVWYTLWGVIYNITRVVH